jgi:hypothetical protein
LGADLKDEAFFNKIIHSKKFCPIIIKQNDTSNQTTGAKRVLN